MVKKDRLKVLLASSEIVPFAKTGGLADVAGALPKNLVKYGCEVKLIMPLYKGIQKKFKLKSKKIRFTLKMGRKKKTAVIYSTMTDKKVEALFIKNDSYYNRDELYTTSKGDYKDNAERFMFFSKAILKTAESIKFRPDIIHCNDWQTGLVSMLLKTSESGNSFFKNTRTVYTIHNIAYQGLFKRNTMIYTGLPAEAYSINGIEYYGKLNMMKAGIISSDSINTVSRKYSREILTKEYGHGMENILKSRKKDVSGILNGIDYNDWSPQKDRFIAKHYSIKTISAKKKCRMDLLKEYGLDKKVPDNIPVTGVISRLADQKGFDILAEVIDKAMGLDLCFILLGTGSPNYHKLFEKIAKKYPERAGIKLTFNNSLAHKIEAGSDIFLMPSRFEPCGLNQIYSLKYGTVPVVRATGGLDDTIQNFNKKTGKGTGFKFKKYSGAAFYKKLKEAVNLYKTDRTSWKKIIKNGMSMNFSWDKSAREYINLYKKTLKKNLKLAI